MLGKTKKDIISEERKSPAEAQEWIPPSLRKRRAFSLALFCVLFAAGLQGFDSAIRAEHGLPASKSAVVNAATYLPTVGAILLGFAWYGVVSDVKKVTPWSNMSKGPTTSAESVSLDYITRLEILSLFAALQRRHWAMFLALLTGLLCGITVALANSLVRIDLFAPSAYETTFIRTSRFNFEDTLVRPVSEAYQYAFPTDYSGSRPYAAVQANRDSNDNPIPWTSGGYTFESFGDQGISANNATLSATVQGFSPNMNCTPWPVTKTTDGYLEAIFPGDSCEDGFREKDFLDETSIDGAAGWLNVTRCKTTSGTPRYWITARLMYDANASMFKKDIQSQWLICDPQFAVQESTVNVNQTTEKIISFSHTLSAAEPVQLGVPMVFMFMILRNPLEPSNQWFSPLNSSITEGELLYSIWQNRGMDPDTFFVNFADAETLYSASARYMNNSNQFNEDVEVFGNSIFAQFVGAFAREEISEEIAGSVVTTEPRLYLRQPFLRALQAVLVLIGAITVIMATVLRPRTLLKDDPGSIAAAALIMSNSSGLVQNLFAGLATSSEAEMRTSLHTFNWAVKKAHGGFIELETSATSDLVDMDKESKKSKLTRIRHSGWKSVSLSWWARLSVGVLLAGMIMVLVLLLENSQTQDGIHDSTELASTLSSVLPTVALLLLGYACSGIDSAVRTLAIFKSLKKGSKNADHLLVNIRDTPFFWLHRHGVQSQPSWALLASSLCFLMIPGLKLVAAGLYKVELFPTTLHNVTAVLDTSLTIHIHDNSSIPAYGSDTFCDRVAELAEWAMIKEWRLSERVGALENLVFTNLTDVGASIAANVATGAELIAPVSAVEVEVNCSEITVDLVGRYQNDAWIYNFQCSTTDCEDAAVAGIFNGSIALGQTDQAGFNETGYWYYGFSRYYGIYGVPTRPLNNQGAVTGEPQLWQAHFIDFSNTAWPLVNKTPVELDSGNQVRVTPEAFGSNLPTITSVTCAVSLNTLEARTTFKASVSSTGLSSKTHSIQWAPASFDSSTITNRTPTDTYTLASMSDWLQPRVASGIETNSLRSDTYFPTDGRATNFFELLAVYATNTLRNASAYDNNPAAFRAATQAVYTAYTVQALLELRPWARAAAAPRRDDYASDDAYAQALREAPNDALRNVTGATTLMYRRERIVQDATSTYVLIGLLGVMLVCLGVVFLLSPLETVLPKSPGSIAARMSLVAGSRLVGDLRRGGGEGLVPLGQTSRFFHQLRGSKAVMGWWPQEEKGKEWRWGIDVGEGCVGGSWHEEPAGRRRSIERLLQDEPLNSNSSETVREAPIDGDEHVALSTLR